MSSSSPSTPALSALDPLLQRHLTQLLDLALSEDIGSGDVSTLATVPAESKAEGRFLAKADGVLSGLAVASAIFERIDPKVRVEWKMKDGDHVQQGTVFGTARGSARSLLQAERLVLNLMQRMSGIATATATYVRTLDSPHTKLLDTRKTVPGLRLLDKLAVAHGGGTNHRLGLYDLLMIKDNHIEASGGIQHAVQAAKTFLQREREAGRGTRPDGQRIEIEVEARTLEEVKEVIACQDDVQRILLDNMVKQNADGTVDTSMLQEALKLINTAKSSGQCTHLLTEASGNVNLKTVHAIGATGVDLISVGALTHSVMALDISMKIKLEK